MTSGLKANTRISVNFDWKHYQAETGKKPLGLEGTWKFSASAAGSDRSVVLFSYDNPLVVEGSSAMAREVAEQKCREQAIAQGMLDCLIRIYFMP